MPGLGRYVALDEQATKEVTEMSTRTAGPVGQVAGLSLASGEFPAHEMALRQEVRDFLADQSFTPIADSWVGAYDPEFSAALGERGWVGMTIPVEYGGGGRSPLERYIVVEELLAAGAPVFAHWVADRQMAPSLLAYGNESLKQRWLPAIASGRSYFAIGLSEPDAGSDLASIRTRAEKVPGGWELTGAKVWTSMAPHAHAIVVLARTEPARRDDRHGGLTQFVVALPSEGVTVRPIEGMNGSEHFGEVVFDRAFVRDDEVLGEPGRGWQQANAELAYERSGPERVLSTAVLLPSVKGAERGRLLARLWALRQASIAVNAAIERGTPPEVQAVMVKDLGTQFENEVVDAALASQRIEPDPGSADGLARLIATARLNSPTFTLRGGTTEILRGIIARGLGVR